MDSDVLVAGAGFAGAVAARRLAEGYGLRCVVADRRPHAGGLCLDVPDAYGVPVPRFGPHWFHSSSERVISFLSRFTAWREVAFRFLAFAEGRHWPFPVNLATYEQLAGRPSTPAEMEAALETWRESCAEPRSSEEYVLSRAGRRLYELFYRGYSRKQWGRDPASLDASACGRIPIRTTRDDRYFDDPFQAVPTGGYAPLFDRLLDHPGIRVVLGADARELRATVPHRRLVWTGPLDDLLDRRLGSLPWRALRWEAEARGGDGFALPAAQVNYTDETLPFTRRFEPAQVHGHAGGGTTVTTEWACAPGPGVETCYPVPAADARALRDRYLEAAASDSRVTLVGRFAQYEHLDMERVVERALDAADRIGPRLAAP
ncbi:MAG: NAD(P)-binding protein [Deltaproteobacteria bacterium]|nr:NAD(P)-binding protein [Deltaproteobacteria bacterium]